MTRQVFYKTTQGVDPFAQQVDDAQTTFTRTGFTEISETPSSLLYDQLQASADVPSAATGNSLQSLSSNDIGKIGEEAYNAVNPISNTTPLRDLDDLPSLDDVASLPALERVSQVRAQVAHDYADPNLPETYEFRPDFLEFIGKFNDVAYFRYVEVKTSRNGVPTALRDLSDRQFMAIDQYQRNGNQLDFTTDNGFIRRILQETGTSQVVIADFRSITQHLR